MPVHATPTTLRRLLTAAAAAALLTGCLPGGGGGGSSRGDRDAAPAPSAPVSGVGGERAVCGDGRVQAGEACDWNAPAASRACAELAPRFVGGEAGCTGECTFDLSACELGGECGNGALEPGEACDDGNLEDQGGCSSACTAEDLEVEGDDSPAGGADAAADVPRACRPARLAEMAAPSRIKTLRLAVHIVRKGRKSRAPRRRLQRRSLRGR